MEKFVLDTNIFIEATRDARDARANAALADWQRRMAPRIYHHSVVVSELLVGARDEATWERRHERWIAPAERVNRVIVPSYGAWLRASRIITQLIQAGKISPGGVKPSFHNDCLLAAASREHGYTIVTHNTADFGLIALVELAVQAVLPFP